MRTDPGCLRPLHNKLICAVRCIYHTSCCAGVFVGFFGLISVYEVGFPFEKLPFSYFYNKRMKSELGDSISLAAILGRIGSFIYLIAFKLVPKELMLSKY